MANKIHAQAIVSPKAQLGNDVSVGPFSIIEDAVEIGEGTTVGPHVIIRNNTRIGKNNLFYQFTNLGETPADLKYQGEQTYLEIGDNNTMREGCIIHRGTAQGGNITRIGSRNYVMPYCHVAHDGQIGDNTILGYTSVLAGHVTIGDYVNLSGGVKVVQHCRIGTHAYVTVDTLVRQDIPAFIIVDGVPRGVNNVGLQRNNFSAERIALITKAYKILYMQQLTMEEATKKIQKLGPSEDLELFVDSYMRHEGRGIVRPRKHIRD